MEAKNLLHIHDGKNYVELLPHNPRNESSFQLLSDTNTDISEQQVSQNVPDYYIARSQAGYVIGLEIVQDKHGAYHLYSLDNLGYSKLTDSFEKGITKSEIDSKLATALADLKTKGFSVEEHHYPQGQKTTNPDGKLRGQSERPQTEKADTNSKIPNREVENNDRTNRSNPQSENKNGIDWGTVTESAGSTIAKGAGIAAAGAGLVALGAVSAPFLVGAGMAFSIGMGINTFFSRANEAMDAGEDDYLGNAAAAGFSDMIPLIDVVGIGEAATGYNYMTGQEMTQQERSEKLGGLIGGVAMDFVPVAGVLSSKNNKSKNSKKLSKKDKKLLEQYEDGITSFTLTNPVKNKERHHAILQALFKRLTDSEVASFIHAGPSLPMTIKLHQQIHKELNEILRSEGFMNRAKQPKNELSKAEFREALQTINEYYYQKAIDNPSNKNYSKLSDSVSTFILTLEKADLL